MQQSQICFEKFNTKTVLWSVYDNIDNGLDADDEFKKKISSSTIKIIYNSLGLEQPLPKPPSYVFQSDFKICLDRIDVAKMMYNVIKNINEIIIGAEEKLFQHHEYNYLISKVTSDIYYILGLEQPLPTYLPPPPPTNNSIIPTTLPPNSPMPTLNKVWEEEYAQLPDLPMPILNKVREEEWSYPDVNTKMMY